MSNNMSIGLKLLTIGSILGLLFIARGCDLRHIEIPSGKVDVSFFIGENMSELYPSPIPTQTPQSNPYLTSGGSSSYYLPYSSSTDPRAANYVNPSSSTSTQVNAYGAPLYQTNPFGTTNQVVKTNYQTGEFQPTPQPGPSPDQGINLKDPNANPGPDYFWDSADGWKLKSGSGGPDYSSYFAELDKQIEGLTPQADAQRQIAENTYQQGMGTLGSQLTQGKADLQANQQKTLRDLSENMRQSWQQGNAMLGTRGASDSSAANQYAFALTKAGNQQRGDVQAQYNQNLFKLQNIYDTESKNLELAKNSQLQQIAQWFAEAQNQLRNVVGQAKLQQSQQAYNTALQFMQNAQQEASSRRAALDQWALNRATSFNEAAKAVGLLGNQQVQAPTMSNLFSNKQASNLGVGLGYGSQDTRKRDIFGNIVG